jgi:hypothetical protein
MKRGPLSTEFYAGILISLLVFAYVCLRAAFISISHDEALTYLVHAHSDFGEIFFHPKFFPANNHLLNTVLIKIFTYLFGDSEFIIRIPALAGCALFIISSYKMLGLFLKKLKLIVGFTLLITNSFLIDFFSCARGYALALGFFWAALYCCFKRAAAAGEDSLKYNILAVAALTLAVLSNIAFINIYLAVSSILVFLELRMVLFGGRQDFFCRVRQFTVRIVFPMAISGFCLCAIYNPTALRLIQADSSGTVGQSGFWQDTIGSLVKCILQDKNYAIPALVFSVKAFIIIFLLASLAAIAYSAVKKKNFPAMSYLFSTGFVFIFMIIAVSLEAIFFKAGYPKDRTAIYVIPLFLLLLVLLWHTFELIFPNISFRPVSGLFYCCALLMIVHNLVSVNLDNFYLWKYDAKTKDAVNLIRHAVEERQQGLGRKYRAGINWLFEPSMNYYIFVNKIRQIEFTTRAGPDGVYDFYYILDTDKPAMEKYNLKVVKAFDLSKTYLAEPINNSR